MADSPAQQRKKLRSMMQRMTKKYSVAKLIHKEPDIELLLYLILREGWDFRKAGRALRKLGEEFVDWNEVRVSYHREIAEVLAFLKYGDLDEKIARLQETLKAVYSEYNRLDLEFLREQDFEETRKVFAGIKPLGRGNAYVFLQCLQDRQDEAPARSSQTLVMSPDALRVGIRLGLIKKTGSLNVGRKEFEKILDPTEYVAFQHLFVRHAEALCKPKNPLCESCFLNTVCKFHQP